MSEPLATYLHDHLAGASFAVDLLHSLRDQYPGDPIGQLASTILVDVEQDREQLQQIVTQVGKGSADLKEAAAWLAEKVSLLKLGRDDAKGLGTFQALEALALGTLGKVALWRALMVVAATDDRLKVIDFESLITRAQTQHAQLEQSRLLLARTALA